MRHSKMLLGIQIVERVHRTTDPAADPGLFKLED
jgi:hypothetical protein